jgi:hypothetical protein
MKQLEKAQKFSQQVPTYPNLENDNLPKDFSNLFNNNNPYIYPNEFYKTPPYHNNQKNNFTEFFDPNDPTLRNPNFIASDLHERNKNNYKKLNDLKREKYGLKETLKELEEKFENGILSEVDYFRTFKNLQKDIYSIEKKIEYLKDKIKDHEILTRNFHKKKI